MTKKSQSYWIKERHNPQLGTYYILEGQLPKSVAKRKENSLYGMNIMLEFTTKEEYDAAIEKLKSDGEHIQ